MGDRRRMRFAGHRRALLVVAGVAIVALIVAFNLRHLERAFIAIRIYRAGVFTPPVRIAGQSGLGRAFEDAQFYWDFAKLRVERE